jgi:membrane protein
LRAYLRYFGRYAGAYGSLTAVIILLIYFYLSGMAVLAGGVLNGVLDRDAVSANEIQQHPNRHPH